MKNLLLAFSLFTILALPSCETTSLSNPGGRSHHGDLSLYGLTGDDPNRAITEGDIARASRGGGRVGSLPWRGARVLLVQSGAHQPDEELQAAFRPHCQAVLWDGRDPAIPDQDDEKKETSGAVGRQLRLIAAQQGCSHVVVVFGEIQSDSRTLPTDSLVGWVPIVGSVVPTAHSGTRVIVQAIILEAGSPRYTLVSASPRQEEGLTTYGGESNANTRRSLRMKRAIYPELAAKSFR